MPLPRPVLPLWAAVIAAVAGGLVYDLGFPGVSWWPLAFVGIAFALVSLIGRSAWGAALVGLAFGLAFYLQQVSWTALYLGPIPWLALSTLESLFVAGGGVLIALAYRWMPRVSDATWVRVLVLPALVAGLWCLRESVVGTFPYGGFPWGRAALSQSESPFADVVSWVGSTGLGFVMVFIVAGIIECIRLGSRRGIRSALPVVAVAAVAMLVPAWQTTDAGTLRVASVQGNGPAGYFDEREPGDVLLAQLDATQAVIDEPGVDVLLWPEGGSDIDPTRSEQVAGIFDELSSRMDAPVLLNTVTMRGDEYFNTSMLWRDGEGAVATYDKRHPVPFGEYIPDRDFYYAIAPDLIGLVQRGYTPGTNPPVFDLGDAVTGLAICFDVIYDDLVWESVDEGAQVFMFQTNNADFTGTDENEQQLAIARLRAIETGRSVVNISTVGTSQVIDSAGRTIDSLPANEPGAMVTDVGLRDGVTPAVAMGVWFPSLLVWGSALGLIAAGVFAGRRRRPDTVERAPATAVVNDAAADRTASAPESNGP